MKKKLAVLLPVFSVIMFLDRLSKTLVYNNMIEYQSIEVWGNFFRITFVKNPYAAFSMRIGNWWFMIALTIFAIMLILFYLVKVKYAFIKIFALSMVLGGAFGNLYERIRYKEVIDFLDFGIKRARFATFNIADSSVVIGVALLIILMFFEKDEKS